MFFFCSRSTLWMANLQIPSHNQTSSISAPGAQRIVLVPKQHTHMFLEGWHFQVGGIGKACSILTHTLMFFNSGCCHRSGRLCLKVWGSTVFCLSPDPTNHLDVWRVLDPSPNQCIGWGSHSAGPCAFPSKEANRLVKGIGAKEKLHA